MTVMVKFNKHFFLKSSIENRISQNIKEEGIGSHSPKGCLVFKTHNIIEDKGSEGLIVLNVDTENLNQIDGLIWP